jgi:beta-lactamase class A
MIMKRLLRIFRRVASIHGSRHFPMQSVYKLPIVMAVLARAASGQLKLDEKIRISPADLVPPTLHSPIRDQNPNGNFEMTIPELARSAIVESDGSASDCSFAPGEPAPREEIPT